jgi:hypothetical protein
MATTAWRNNRTPDNPEPWFKEPVMMSEEEKAKFPPVTKLPDIPPASLPEELTARLIAAGIVPDPARVKTEAEIESEGRALTAGGTRIPESAKCGGAGCSGYPQKPPGACLNCTPGRRDVNGSCSGWCQSPSTFNNA